MGKVERLRCEMRDGGAFSVEMVVNRRSGAVAMLQLSNR